MLLLFVVTGFYTRSFNRQSRQRGRQHYQSAQALAVLSDYEQAAEQYRDALLYSHDNPDYRLGLALALYESERYTEARHHLMALRPDDPTSGIVNKLLGRLAADDERVDEAVTYYRTAIYGRWTDNAERERLQSRLELIELLDRNGRMRQLTAELLADLDVMPDDKATKRRLAGLLLKTQVADKASALFREFLRDDRRDREALVGRAEAEFLLGNYLTARTHFNYAQGVRKEESTAQRIALCSAVIALDPNRRGIESSREKIPPAAALCSRVTAEFIGYCRNPLGETFVGPPASGFGGACRTAGARARFAAARRPPTRDRRQRRGEYPAGGGNLERAGRCLLRNRARRRAAAARSGETLPMTIKALRDIARGIGNVVRTRDLAGRRRGRAPRYRAGPLGRQPQGAGSRRDAAFPAACDRNRDLFRPGRRLLSHLD